MICNHKTSGAFQRFFMLVAFVFGVETVAAGQLADAQNNLLQASSASPLRNGASGTPAGIQSQNPLLGSVPTGKATGTVMPLSLREALDRGLKYNLGLIESEQSSRATRAERLKNLSKLLPDVKAGLSGTVEQVNLKALGINFPFRGVPTVVGPFGVADARAYLSQTLFDWSDLKQLQSASESVKASEFLYRNSRDLVVLAVGNAYLQVISSGALVDSVRAQVKTAQSLYQKALDQKKAGVIAAIDLLRAQVELQVQQQRLIAQENQLAKDKLSLARVIGLPTGQELLLTDTVPYAPLAGASLQEALPRAYNSRSDFLSAKAQVHAAELARRAAVGENYPSLSMSANYGDIGPNFGTSHGTFTVAGTLNIPIFQGKRVSADVLQADATLQQRRAELEDLRGRIDYDVRSSLLDLTSAAEEVEVAKSNVDLAGQTLIQAQDRFAAGVADNIEVVQAQESVATANQSYISSLYAHNVAKLSLARAVGIAEQAVKEYLGGR